ncbi:heparinase II/III-family protein [bacterium]|nr:heparinase II/III-family protein [bacterium]
MSIPSVFPETGRRATLAAILVFASFAFAAPALAASAPTGPWMPEITERPRLLFGPGDIDEMRDRAGREPYATLLSRIRSRANSGFDPVVPAGYSEAREYANADTAKAAALVAIIDENSARADKAASILEVVDTEGWTLYQLFDADIHIGEALGSMCVAYDTLAGSGYVDGARLDGIADRIGLLLENLYADFWDKLAFWTTLSYSNHSIKINAGLALCAMALNDHPDASKWFHIGFTETYRKLFDINLSDEGAYAEGTYYGAYTGVTAFPFLLSYNRLVGTGGAFWERDPCLFGPGCNWRSIALDNPIDHPRFHAMGRWYTAIRLPGGGKPPIDDANIEGFFNGLVGSATGDGLLLWDWLTDAHDPLMTNHAQEIAAETYAFYDDSIAPEPPGPDFGPSFFLPDAGQAVLRSGWGDFDTWTMMIAEHGDVRKVGHGHEHPDNLSVTLHALGEYLLIDPGYGSWGQRLAVNKAHHHNLPTVDGEGPDHPGVVTPFRGQDAFLTDGVMDGSMPFAVGESSWHDADFTRSVIMLSPALLVVIDEMESDTPRTFGLWWHGNAGGDAPETFELFDDGAAWHADAASVDVRVASTAGPVAYDTTTNIHGFAWQEQTTHTSMHVEAADVSDDTEFVSIIQPYENAPAAVSWRHLDDGAIVTDIDAAEGPVFVLAQERRVKRRLNMGGAIVTTDARVAVMRGDARAGDVWLSDVSRFDVGDARIVPGKDFGRLEPWKDDGTLTASIPRARAMGPLGKPAELALRVRPDPRVRFVASWTGETVTLSFGRWASVDVAGARPLPGEERLRVPSADGIRVTPGLTRRVSLLRR